MSYYDDIINILRECAEQVKKIREDNAYLAARINDKSGKYAMSIDAYKRLQEENEGKIKNLSDGALNSIEAIYAQMMKAAKEADKLNPDQLNDDMKLLQAGVKLSEKDLADLLERNANNRTMTQMIYKYADDNGYNYNLGRYEPATTAAQAQIDDMRIAVKLYHDHWLNSDKGVEMIGKMFNA